MICIAEKQETDMVKRSTVAKRAAPAKPKAAASVRPRVTEPEIPAAQSKAPSEPAAADVIEANQEGQGDGKAQQEGSGADHGATPKPQPPVEETGNQAASQDGDEAPNDKPAEHPQTEIETAIEALCEKHGLEPVEVACELTEALRCEAEGEKQSSEDLLRSALSKLMPSAEEMDQINIDLVVSGLCVLKDGKRLPPSEYLEGLALQSEQQDQPVDLVDLDVNAVAANTAQAAASELVLQLMPWPMEPGEDGEDDVPVDSWDPELWINGCCAGPSVDGDLSPHEILAAYSASRPGVVPGDALYRQAHKLGLHDGKVDAFYELPEALQLAYGIFAKTAWSTARALRRLAAVAAENALPAAGVPEPGRGFSTKDEDDPIHQPGERGWR